MVHAPGKFSGFVLKHARSNLFHRTRNTQRKDTYYLIDRMFSKVKPNLSRIPYTCTCAISCASRGMLGITFSSSRTGITFHTSTNNTGRALNIIIRPCRESGRAYPRGIRATRHTVPIRTVSIFAAAIHLYHHADKRLCTALKNKK